MTTVSTRTKLLTRCIAASVGLVILSFGMVKLRGRDTREVLNLHGEALAGDISETLWRTPYSLEGEVERNREIAAQEYDALSAIYAYEEYFRRGSHNRMVRIIEAARAADEGAMTFLNHNIIQQAGEIDRYLNQQGNPSTDGADFATSSALQIELSLWLRAKHHLQEGTTPKPFRNEFANAHATFSRVLTD